MARNIVDVIDSILCIIPVDEHWFINELNNIKDSASFAAPELSYLGWQRLTESMMEAYGASYPTKDWEFNVTSIISAIPIDELRIQVAEYIELMEESKRH